MKTSNKVLFGGLATILLTSIVVMGIGRSSMKVFSAVECNALPRTSKTLQLEFTEVNIGHSVEAILKQGEFNIEVDATESAMPHVNHHVENGVLHLNLEEVSVSEVEPCPINVVITAPQLDKIFIANGSRINNTEIFETSNLEIAAVNGSVVSLSVNVDYLKTSATNSSNIEIAGEVTRLTLSAKNSAQIQLPNANVNTAKVSLSNSSTAMINADTISQANLMNSSQLNYFGSPIMDKMDVKNSSGLHQLSDEKANSIQK